MSVVNTFLSQPDNWPLPAEPLPRDEIEAAESMARSSAEREEPEATVQTALGIESSLIRQTVAGDDKAFEELISPHMPRLRQIAYNRLQNREDADEAVQDALLSAYRNLMSFRGQSLFSTWLTRIVINAAKMVRRRNMGRPEVSLDEILDADQLQKIRAAVDPRQNPERACGATEIGALIDRELRQLSPLLEQAFRLREIEGLSTEACLARLGIQLSAFKSRVTRARHQLASSLRLVTPTRYQHATTGK